MRTLYPIPASLLLLLLATCGLTPTVYGRAAQVPANLTPGQEVDRTTAAQAKMTARQRVHSKLFNDPKNRASLPFKRPLDTLLSYEGRSAFFEIPFGPPKHVPDRLQSDACAADGVLLVTVGKMTSSPIDDGMFFFSDYDVEVDEAFRQPKSVHLQKGDDSVVTRLGGIIEIEGKQIRTIPDGMPLLQVQQSYLLFLRYLPETRDFFSPSQYGTYQIDFSQPDSPRFIGFGFVGDFYEEARPTAATVLSLLRSLVCR